MNIWYFCLDPRLTSSDNVEAPSIHMMETIRALRAQGQQVRHFLYGDIVRQTERALRQTAQEVGRKHRLFRSVKPLLRDIYELYRDTQDIHFVDPVFRDNPIDLVYERLVQNKSSVSACTQRYEIPLIVESNAPGEERKEYWGAPLMFFARRLEKRVFQRADAFTVVSTSLKKYYERMGVDARKIFVLPNGVNQERFSPQNVSRDVRTELGLDDKVVIGFVGNIFAYHGIELFLPLARDCTSEDDTHFLIVGGGQGRKELRSALERERLDSRFTFIDAIPNTEVPNYLAAMDICILPRFMWYGSPMKIFEYGAMGKAILAPDQENIRDVLTHGETAFLFEAGNLAALAQAIRELVADEGLRVRLGNAARKYILTNHTWEKNAERILDICRQIVS